MRENLKLPLISVIVPVHNGQDYLKNCINSILAQTYRPLEIIIVNDGSVDRTGEICRELENAHENIFVLMMEDLGVSAGRNAGLDRMRGEYVAFVDADDRIHPRMLEILYQILVETKSDVSGCRFFAWRTEEEWKKGVAADAGYGAAAVQETGTIDAGRRSGTSADVSGAQKSIRIFTQKQFVLEGILKNDTRCWSKLYKKECIQNVRFRKGLTIGEDMLFLIDLLPCMRRSVSTDFSGYGYFQNPHGAMNRQFKPSYMDQITCWKLAGEALAAWMAGMEESVGTEKKAEKSDNQTENPAQAGYREKLTRQEICRVEETIASRQMIGILLTVGKIADLPAEKRRENQSYVETCHRRVKECLAAGKGMEGLDRGYRCKVKLFAAVPQLYVCLYGTLRRLTR